MYCIVRSIYTPHSAKESNMCKLLRVERSSALLFSSFDIRSYNLIQTSVNELGELRSLLLGLGEEREATASKCSFKSGR